MRKKDAVLGPKGAKKTVGSARVQPKRNVRKPMDEPPEKAIKKISPIEEMFHKYASQEDEKQIMADGIVNLGTDMGIDAAKDTEMLVFMWKCECENYGCISSNEFEIGLKSIGITGPANMKAKKKELSNYLKTPKSPDHRKFFKFIFNFHKQNTGQKTLDFNILEVLLGMTLLKHYKICAKFIKFCKEKEKKFLNLDQWENLVDMFEIMEKDPKSFDADGACIYIKSKLFIIKLWY